MTRSLGLLLALLTLAPSALARDIEVGEGGEARRLDDAVAASRPGDRLVLAPGSYQASDLAIPHDLTILGRGEVVIASDGPVAKGLLVPLAGADVTVRNVTLTGARSPDRNGAGIRFEGGDLMIEDATFLGNENGVLATGSPFGCLTVRRSLFEGNGHGDGYSHGVYQSSGARLVVEDSRFVGTRVGHHLKSLAPFVAVTGNSFDDAGGRPSYVVDATGGGALVITRNEVVRRPGAEQDTLFNYDTSRGGELGGVTVEGNRLITEKPRVRLLRNPEGAPATVEGNELIAAGRGGFRDLPDGVEPARGEAPPLPAATARPRLPERGGVAGTEALSRFHLATGEGLAGDRGVRFAVFGQALPAGLHRPGAPLTAVIEGTRLPTQVDVKATHPDGSSRHLVVIVALPASPHAGLQGDGVLLAEAPPPLAPLLEAAGPVPSPAAMRLAVSGGVTAERPVGEPEPDEGTPWLDGPLVTELTRTHRLSGRLTVREDTRLFADGERDVRLTFENHEVMAGGPPSLTYDVEVRDGGELAFGRRGVSHHRSAGWTAWADPPAYVAVPDPAQMLASGAFPPLGPMPASSYSATDEATGEREAWDQLDLSDVVPLTPYMPTTGGRDEIGPVTGWTARWLASRGPGDAHYSGRFSDLVRVGTIGLSVPWHLAEDGAPITPASRPGFWADARGAGPDGLPAEAWSEAPGGWTPDLAHKPDLAFPAYLATGEAVFARALAHEAAYAVTGLWPELRGPDGVIVTDALQLREAAWSLRTIANAAWGLPDDDPLRAEFQAILDANLAHLRRRFVEGGAMDAAGEAEGYLPTDAGRNPDAVAPWQQDFMAIVLAQEALRGSRDARAVLEWMTPWLAGRVLAAPDVRLAYAPEHVVIRDGRRLASWEEVYAATPKAEEVSVADAQGHYAVLLAALSMTHAATGAPEAAQALGRLEAVPGAEALRDPDNRLGYARFPQFAIERP